MKYLLPIGVLMSAAASLAVEIVIVRLGAPYVGQSLLPWSAAITSVLLGLTAGHFCGGLIGGPSASLHRLRCILAVAWLAAGLCALIAPALAEPIALEFLPRDGSDTATILAIAALAAPASFAAGFSAPLAVRIALVMPGIAIPRMVGAIYAASAVGSVVGSAAAGIWLLEMAGAVGSMRVIGCLWLVLALIAMPSRDLTMTDRRLAAIAVAAAIAMMAAVRPHTPCLVESRYTCIQLFDRTLADGGLVRFMELDDGIHSASDRDDPARLHLGYAALVDRLARAAFTASDRPHALTIGGGGATLPRAWAAASSAANVTVAELDATVAAMAADAMWAGKLPNLRTVIGDGRAILRSLPRTDVYDVILMDAYRTRSVPPHLVTAEFNAQVASRLTPRGVFISNIIDRSSTPLLALSVARTLAQSFPMVDIWIAVGEEDDTTNVIVAAWKDPGIAFRPADYSTPATVMKGDGPPRSRQVTWRRIDQMHGEYWPQACAALLTDDWTPVDRLLAGRPVCALSSR